VVVPRPADNLEEARMHHLPVDSQDEAVKRFFLSLPVDPQGSVVELNGQPVACVVPMPSTNGATVAGWNDEKNSRRCDLIDKKYAGNLTASEAIELRSLQEQMLRFRESIAPLPLADVRRLHQALLAKAQQQRS
jgi:hypothetical protein